MSYKGKLTTADILHALRQRLLAARSSHDQEELRRLAITIIDFEDMARARGDRPLKAFLEDMGEAINDTVREEEWKSTIPSVEAINAMEMASQVYEGVQATILRRAVVPTARRPFPFYAETTGEQLDADWVALAEAHGPYRTTVDLVFYAFDGAVRGCAEYDTLDQALLAAATYYGIGVTDWEECHVPILDEEGRVAWTPDAPSA